MNRRRMPFIALIVLVIVAAVTAFQWNNIAQIFSPAKQYEFHGTAVNPPRPAPDFTLVDQHGQPYRLGDQDGQAVLLFFGYTNCPDVCPQTMVDFMRIKTALGDRADEVQFVFVTLDPQRDTTDVLKEYMELFDSEFIGLSGDPDTLQAAWDAYGTFAQSTEPDENGHYWVMHSSFTYAIDKAGDLRVRYSFDTLPAHIVTDLQHIIG